MNVLCLMPTYGRPRHLVEAAIECWKRQTWPDKWLLILDDERYWQEQPITHDRKFGVIHCPPIALSGKYNYGREWHLETRRTMFADGNPHSMAEAQAIAVWDDDDLYGPSYLERHVLALAASGRGWSHPSRVWSTYTGKPEQEPATGRFHGSLMVRWNLARWPEITSPLFDQMMLAKLAETGAPADPCTIGEPQYCFRWNDTGSAHVQHYMTAEHGDNWQAAYQAAARAARDPERDRPDEPLVGRFDEQTEKLWRSLWGK